MEDTLPKRFDRPVSIFVGLGFPLDVETLLDAFHILAEWTGTRGPDHERAYESCRLALSGRIDVTEARQDFEAFASERGILARDAIAVAATRLAREWQPGGRG